MRSVMGERRIPIGSRAVCRRAVVVGFALLTTEPFPIVSAQIASGLSFEVASVKPTPRERLNRLRTDYCQNGGRFVVGGTPVMWSLKYAYRLKDYQVLGAPVWL